LRGAFTLVQGNFGGLWGLLANDQRSLVLLILLTIFLLLAASTIKGASKKSSSDKKKRINLGKPSSAEKRS
jgi:uncharacterized membrane protein